MTAGRINQVGTIRFILPVDSFVRFDQRLHAEDADGMIRGLTDSQLPSNAIEWQFGVAGKLRLKDDTAERSKARYVGRTTSPTIGISDSTLG